MPELMNHVDFRTALENAIKGKSANKAPFSIAWASGKLSREHLARWAENHFHYVGPFADYLAYVYARMPDGFTEDQTAVEAAGPIGNLSEAARIFRFRPRSGQALRGRRSPNRGQRVHGHGPRRVRAQGHGSSPASRSRRGDAAAPCG